MSWRPAAVMSAAAGLKLRPTACDGRAFAFESRHGLGANAEEPRPGAPVVCVLQILAVGLTLTADPEWWMWGVGVTVIVVGAVGIARWVREDRRYRAWVEWDEAGGPDVAARRGMHGNEF